MTIEVELQQIELPVFWGPALLNDDWTGYTDLEIRQIKRFVRDMIALHGSCWCIDVGDEMSFSWCHEAQEYGVRACDTAVFTFDVTGRD